MLFQSQDSQEQPERKTVSCCRKEEASAPGPSPTLTVCLTFLRHCCGPQPFHPQNGVNNTSLTRVLSEKLFSQSSQGLHTQSLDSMNTIKSKNVFLFIVYE